MFENDVSPSISALANAPLSTAFNRAWSEWLTFWQAMNRTSPAPTQVSQVAEEISHIARRLWRSSFAAVGDAQGDQAKATLFAFIGLLDECLLFENWAGQSAWEEQPMEARLFNSRSAGDRIPVAIKKLLENRDPAQRDLANVYLHCLILGFQGRLRNGNGKGLHEKWRRALFAFSRQRHPSLNEIQHELEAPSARPPQQMPLRSSLPDGYRLALVMALGLLLCLAISQGLWWNIEQRVQPELNQDAQKLISEQTR